ncbi:MAG: cation diffusion facilitator family transporter [Candidatus Eisenbacteria bacterium]
MAPHAHSGSRRALAMVLALNALSCLVEFAAGWWTNSLALLSDAGHMLGDVGAIALSLAAATLAARPAAPDKTWGWWRSEILAAMVNGVTLVVIAALVFVEAVRRLGSPPDVPGPAIVVVATFGLLINLISVAALSAGRRGDLNLRGAFLHSVSDALGSIGAIVAGVLVMTRGWTLADPLASIFIAVLVAVAGVGLLRDTVHVLMEGAPASIRVDRLRGALEGSSGVRAVHDLHVWSLTSRFPAVSAHVVADPALSLAEGQVLLDRLRGMLLEEFEVRHVTLQLETLAAEGCDPCAEPTAGNSAELTRGS